MILKQLRIQTKKMVRILTTDKMVRTSMIRKMKS